MNKDDKKAFLIYKSDKVLLLDMNREQKGYFFEIIMDYEETDELPEVIDDPLVRMAVRIKVDSLKRDKEKYEQTCKRRSEAANKRWNKEKSEAEINNIEINNPEIMQGNAIASDCIQNNMQNYTNDGDIRNKIYEKDKEKDNDIRDKIKIYDEDTDKEISTSSANAEFRPSVYNQPIEKNHFQAESIVAMYNNICNELPSVQRATKERLIAVENLINKGYKPTDFQKAFEKSQESEFLKHGKDGGWSANFDWIIQEKNLVKILEGNYDNKNTKNPPNQAETETIDHELDKYRSLINQFDF